MVCADEEEEEEEDVAIFYKNRKMFCSL